MVSRNKMIPESFQYEIEFNYCVSFPLTLVNLSVGIYNFVNKVIEESSIDRTLQRRNF